MNYKENKQVLLTLFITMIMMVATMSTYSQTIINPDTVCVNAVGEQYFVANTATSTYQWTITGGGGILQAGQGSNSITANWGAIGGLYLDAVEIVESNASGCPGTPILLDVYILNLSIGAIGPFCPGDPSATLIGNPSGGAWSGTGVIGNDFDPATAGVGNYVLTYSMAGCNATINVIVNNGPITGPIQHY